MMNERIRELAEQATVFVADYDGQRWQIDPEKFAELIVQRTLAIVEAHTEIFQSDEARAMVEHIKRSVKTDFGVEE
jgi:dTDP-4-amino-4,6-dideoxygalactose transaminase